MRAVAVAALVVLVLAAPASAEELGTDEEERTRKDGLVIEFAYFPAVALTTDLDHDAGGRTGIDEPDLKHDDGFGVWVGAGGFDPDTSLGGSLSLGYTYGLHRLRREETFAELHALFLEFRVTQGYGGGSVKPTFGGTLGLGGAVLDFDRFYDDTGGVIFRFGLLFGLRFFERLELRAEPGIAIIGYPTNTIADGAYIGLGVTYTF